MSALLPKSGRTFSRAMVVSNCVVAWCMVGGAMVAGEGVAGIVVPAALTLIAWLIAGYMGVGALDFRTAAQAARPPQGPQS